MTTAKSSRRSFLKTAAAIAPVYAAAPGLAAALGASTGTAEMATATDGGPFTLPPLGYPYDSLEPYIDKETMVIHHDKHHAAYVKSLNGVVKGHPEVAGKSIEELVAKLDTLPKALQTGIRNYGGGHLNHALFWETMSPKSGREPKGALAEAIRSVFGSLDNLKAKFNEAGAKRFGSGWAWLVRTSDGGLEVLSTANQVSPLSSGKHPLMLNDVWEHAYYLKYQNRRGEYLTAWWNVVNWDKVSERFEKVS